MNGEIYTTNKIIHNCITLGWKNGSFKKLEVDFSDENFEIFLRLNNIKICYKAVYYKF